MSTTDPFLIPIPQHFAQHEDPEVRAWFNFLFLHLSNNREDATDTETTQTAQGETQTTQGASITTLETQMALIATSLPAYTISNETTDRAFDANSAVTGTGIDVAAAGPANVALLSDHDALVAVVQELADVQATVINDLVAKNVLGT